MKRFLLTVMAATVIVLATGRAVPPAAEESPAKVMETTGVMPTGPLLGPLTPDGTPVEAVAVPEPVWASILAAAALTLLRRGRHL